MKIEEIRALGDEDLKKQLEESYKELFNLRFRLAIKQPANYQEAHKVRKKIARVKTILRERELAGRQS